MAARERDALEALELAIKDLDNHRAFIRGRKTNDENERAHNVDVHELCTQALNHARTARLWAVELVERERASGR